MSEDMKEVRSRPCQYLGKNFLGRGKSQCKGSEVGVRLERKLWDQSGMGRKEEFVGGWSIGDGVRGEQRPRHTRKGLT